MKKGFTLAEVLITLCLIGIVAALSLPAIKTDIDKQAWIGGLKADMNILTNAFSRILAEEDVSDLRETTFWDSYTLGTPAQGEKEASPATSNDEIKKYFGNYLKIEKPITTGFPSKYKLYDINNAPISGNTPVDWSVGKRIYLPNSTTLLIVFDTVTYPTEDNSKVFSKRMANILIDTNGDKAPNTLGKDVHAFMLAPDGSLYAYGSDAVNLYSNSFPKWNSESGCQGKQPATGYYCTQRIIDEGFKITYY